MIVAWRAKGESEVRAGHVKDSRDHSRAFGCDP